MALFKLNAGADLDLLTKDEVKETLKAWALEIGRGVKFRQISARTDVAAGTWIIGGVQPNNNQETLGPKPGFIWAVNRIALSGNGLVLGTDTFSVYTNEVSPSKLIESGLTRGARWDVPVVVLNGGDQLALAGVGTGAGGTDVALSGQVVELPEQLSWHLL